MVAIAFQVNVPSGQGESKTVEVQDSGPARPAVGYDPVITYTCPYPWLTVANQLGPRALRSSSLGTSASVGARRKTTSVQNKLWNCKLPKSSGPENRSWGSEVLVELLERH